MFKSIQSFVGRKLERKTSRQRNEIAETASNLTYGSAKYWRDTILRMYHIGLNEMGGKPDIEPSDHLHIQREAETYYTEAKQSIGQSPPGEDISDLQAEAFIMAVLLFTYGRMDVVEDVLNYDPDPRVNLRELRRCFWYLMPQDELKSIWNDKQKALAWFEVNKHRLRWDSAQERYYRQSDYAEVSELAET